MGDLKPIGSEKLTGQSKLARIMEIARYGETPKSEINESSTNEYSRVLADGHTYTIVREKSGYIVKKGINESELDYIEPMKNRKYYKSFSQAMKKINLVAGELNRIHENQEGINMFGEQKKFVLKTPEVEVDDTPAIEDTPASDDPSPSVDADLSVDAVDTPSGDDLDIEMDAAAEAEGDIDIDAELGGDMGDEEISVDDEEDEMNFKTIEKLTGKLGQKLRKMDQAEGLTSDNMKYVINSILSALDLNNLDEADREDILAYFEEDEDSIDYGVDDETDLDVELGGDDLDLGIDSEVELEPEMETEESVYSESKIDKVLSKYYQINESEVKAEQEKKVKKFIENKIKNVSVKKVIKEFAETVEQELASEFLVKESNNLKFIGKTNLKNLVFEADGKQVKITRTGELL